jgi:hypothetical protein
MRRALQKIPAGFELYEARGRSMITTSREPLVAVLKNHLVLNPTLLKKVNGVGYVLLLWNEAEKEVGIWGFRNKVPGAEKLSGGKRQRSRYVSWRGFRNKFLTGDGHAGEIFHVAQDKENRDFFRFSMKTS